MITLKHAKEEVIAHLGDNADSFYIIKEGSVSIRKEGNELCKMMAGECFGE